MYFQNVTNNNTYIILFVDNLNADFIRIQLKSMHDVILLGPILVTNNTIVAMSITYVHIEKCLRNCHFQGKTAVY